MKKPTRQMRPRSTEDSLSDYIKTVNVPSSILKDPDDKSASIGPTHCAITQTFQWQKGSSILHQQKTAIAFLEKALHDLDEHYGIRMYYWVLEFTKNMDIHTHIYIHTTRSHNFIGLSVQDYYKLNMRVGFSLFKEVFDIPGWIAYLEKDFSRTEAALQTVHDKYCKQADKYKGYKHLRGKYKCQWKRTAKEIDYEALCYSLCNQKHDCMDSSAPAERDIDYIERSEGKFRDPDV